MTCMLDPELHQCPYLQRETLTCTNPGSCSMQEQAPEQRPQYVRKERWYEQYYKRK